MAYFNATMNRSRSTDRDAKLWNAQLPIAAGVALLVMMNAPACAQAPDAHAQHHEAAPSAQSDDTSSAPPSEAGSMSGMNSGTGGMGGGAAVPGMGGMMSGMEGTAGGMGEMGRTNTPPPLYPSFMAMPELTPERRQALASRADQYIAAGRATMSEAYDRLTAAMESGDAAAQEQASVAIREGFARVKSGITLRRALQEGVAPRDVALDWFRREMNLAPLASRPAAHGFLGLSWFHYIVMFIVTAFAVAMTGMQFRKMRRAEALMARLAVDVDAAVAGAPPSTATELALPIPVPAASGPMPPVNPVIAPSRPNSWSGLLRVARIFQETPSVKTFRLIDPLFGKLPFTYLPGQFLTVTVAPDGEPIKRSYTISSSPTERDYCEITVKREENGAVSRFLHDQVNEDDTLQITAPSGKFTFSGEEATSIVLIAGGVGITPMMSVVRYLTKRSWLHDIYLLYAVRGEEEIIFREELQYLQRRYPNLHVLLFAENVDDADQRFIKGRITRSSLEARIGDLPTRRVHICGPLPMMNAVKATLVEIGVPADRIHTEVFPGKEPPREKLDAVPAAQTKVAVVTFAKSHRAAMMPPTKTVLEASEDVGVNIPYSCRIGVCGICRTRLLSGSVTMEVQDGLEPGDKENNIILACQAKSNADVSVDA